MMIPTSISSLWLFSVVLLVDQFVNGLDMKFILYKASKHNDNKLYTGEPIQYITDGDDYDLQVVGNELTMIVELEPITGYNKPYVKFQYETEERLDKTSPYSLQGGISSIGQFNKSEYLSVVGTKHIIVNVYGTKGQNNNTVSSLLTKTITFTLSDSGIKEMIQIDKLFLVRANTPKTESALALISDGMTVDLVKIFDEKMEPDIPMTYPLPLALYVRFKGGIIKPKSVNFNFYYNSTNIQMDKDGIYGTIGKSNSEYSQYDILPDLMLPGYKTVTINAYDDTTSPLIFTKTYHFTINAHPNFDEGPIE